MATEPASRPASTPTVDDEAWEFARQLSQVLRGLKRGGPGVPEPFRAAFEAHTLGPRHLPPLMTVAFEGPVTISELATMIGLTPATTSLMVGELDRAGLLARAEDDEDRR